MTSKKNIDKDRLIKNEVKRLTELLSSMEKSRRLTTNGLIVEAAYMKATLQEFKNEIDRSGVVDIMPQGEYSIVRANPTLKAYNTMVQRYAAILLQLTNLLPKEIKEDDPLDEFDRFVQSRDSV